MTIAVANNPRTSITCPIFMESDIILLIASLAVNAAIETAMNKAPRRFGERGKEDFRVWRVFAM